MARGNGQVASAARKAEGKTIVFCLGPGTCLLEQFAVDINGNSGLERLSVGNQRALLFL